VGAPVRSQLQLCLDLTTGGVRVLRLSKLPPHQQPAFDAAQRGKTGAPSLVLPALTSALVRDLRATLVPPTTLAARLSRELSNDALLAGVSLTRLAHPWMPLVVVL